MRLNDPPETKQTYERLVREGHSKDEAKRLLGCVLIVEMHDMMQKQREFDRDGYVQALNRLPELPGE